MNQRFAVVDIEATGGNHRKGKMIEISIVILENGTMEEVFTSLVNPEVRIDQYVQKLTGISDAMLVNAPVFSEIAEQVAEALKGAIFVAHNVSFDYQFTKAELKRSGIDFQAQQLCTVKLSQRLFPSHPSYSLAKICADLEIPIDDRHRASGDALATTRLLRKLLEHPDAQVEIEDLLQNQMPESPSVIKTVIPHDLLTSLPEDPGVYYLKNKENKVLYIGRGHNIKLLVIKHFRNNKEQEKFRKFRGVITDIQYELSGNELVAELMYYKVVLEQKPILNLHLKQLLYRYCICLKSLDGYYWLAVAKVKDSPEQPLEFFKDYKSAEKRILKIAHRFNLPSGLISNDVGKAKSSKTMEQLAAMDQGRMQDAIAYFKKSHDSYVVVGEGRYPGEFSIVGIQNGELKGFTFIKEKFDVEKISEYQKQIIPMEVVEGEKIVKRFIDDDRSLRVLPIE